ncbi:MAG: hypothetical protein KDD66_09070 [Bdellovibrionales bacterium]|nr:hypothetical protein [Bdellovibrionales bacterium]
MKQAPFSWVRSKAEVGPDANRLDINECKHLSLISIGARPDFGGNLGVNEGANEKLLNKNAKKRFHLPNI